MTQQFLTWAVVLFGMGFLMHGVNNWAHLGGFASGYVMGQRLRGRNERQEGRNAHFVALGLLGLTLLGFVLSIVRLLPFFLRGE